MASPSIRPCALKDDGPGRRLAQSRRQRPRHVQLIDALNGTHLGADRFDASLEDVFDLQDKIASSVAGIIEPALPAAEIARLADRPTNDLTAYDLYLRAYEMYFSSARQIPAALYLLERAIERDPRYGPALAWAAVCCLRLEADGGAVVLGYFGRRVRRRLLSQTRASRILFVGPAHGRRQDQMTQTRRLGAILAAVGESPLRKRARAKLGRSGMAEIHVRRSRAPRRAGSSAGLLRLFAGKQGPFCWRPYSARISWVEYSNVRSRVGAFRARRAALLARDLTGNRFRRRPRVGDSCHRRPRTGDGFRRRPQVGDGCRRPVFNVVI
jgi:hypothetical protein